MTLRQAELVLEEQGKYAKELVDKAANVVMEDYYLEETMLLRRE